MSMNAMYELRDKLCDELDEIARKTDFSLGDLDVVHKAVGTIKNIDKIAMLEGGYSRDGYSRAGSWEADMRGTYGRGNSYKRDSMGRYSRNSDIDRAKEMIERMMHDAESPEVKEAIRQCMNMLEKA